MKYHLEHVVNIFGSFWVLYEDDGVCEREYYFSRDLDKALKVLHDLCDE